MLWVCLIAVFPPRYREACLYCPRTSVGCPCWSDRRCCSSAADIPHHVRFSSFVPSFVFQRVAGISRVRLKVATPQAPYPRPPSNAREIVYAVRNRKAVFSFLALIVADLVLARYTHALAMCNILEEAAVPIIVALQHRSDIVTAY